MMKVWGMLSVEDEDNGYALVLDEEWFVVLLNKGETIARFDPRDYTSTELLAEVGTMLRSLQKSKSQ